MISPKKQIDCATDEIRCWVEWLHQKNMQTIRRGLLRHASRRSAELDTILPRKFENGSVSAPGRVRSHRPIQAIVCPWCDAVLGGEVAKINDGQMRDDSANDG